MPSRTPRSEAAEQLADPQDALRAYDETFLECRDLRHPWQALGYYRNNGEVRRALVCTRCGMERTDVWSSGGARVGSNYAQPEGYAIRGTEHVSYAYVRVEVMRRANVYRSENQMRENATAPRRTRRRSK